MHGKMPIETGIAPDYSGVSNAKDNKWKLYSFTMYYQKDDVTDQLEPGKEYEIIKSNFEKRKKANSFKEITDFVTADSVDNAFKAIDTYKWLYISMHGFPTYIRVCEYEYRERKYEWNKQKRSEMFEKTNLKDNNGECYKKEIKMEVM